MAEVAQVLARAELVVEALVAPEQHAEPSAYLYLVLGDVEAVHLGDPGGRDEQRRQHLDRRGLARSVGPEDAEDPAAPDGEADAADRLDGLAGPEPPLPLAVGADQVGHGEGGVAGAGRSEHDITMMS
jgi:hypothetical protein